MRETFFKSDSSISSHEHFLSIVATSYHFVNGYVVDTFQYNVASHVYDDTEIGAGAHWRYELSPLEIRTSEVRKPLYQWLTSVCAILGGVYTMVSLYVRITYILLVFKYPSSTFFLQSLFLL
jgi:Endoplasmic reticulum vesicle transporter